MNATLAALLILDINSPRRQLHYHCTTHEEIADQTASHLIGDQERDERTAAR